MIFIAIAIVIYGLLMYSKTPKPRKVFASVTTHGLTERDSQEIVQITSSLFDDESKDEWQKKINDICELREARLEFQNKRMLAHHAELKEKAESLEKQILDGGGKIAKLQK